MNPDPRTGVDCLDPDAEYCIGILNDTETPAQLVAEMRRLNRRAEGPFSSSAARFQNAEMLEIRNQSGEVLARQFELIADIPKVPGILIKDLLSEMAFDPIPIFMTDEKTLSTIDAPASFAKLGLIAESEAQDSGHEVNDAGQIVVRRGTAVTASNILPPDSARSQYIASLLNDRERPLTLYEKGEFKTWLSLMQNATDLPPHMVDFVSQVLSDTRLPKDTIWLIAKPMVASEELARRILPQALTEIEAKTEDAKYFAGLIASYSRSSSKSDILSAHTDTFLRAFEFSSPEIQQILQPVAERLRRDL